MIIDPKKPELRLVMQCSVPLEDIAEGEVFYGILKEIIKNHSVKSTVNGQIMKMLEPCCDKKLAIGEVSPKGGGVQPNAEKNTQVV